MEAKLRRCPFEWVNVTIEYEQPLRSQRSLPRFTRYSSLLAFVCFGTSSVAQRLVTISSNCFEFYTKYQHVITLFFGATYCLSRDVLQKTTNISQSFQKGAWTKQALLSRNVLKRVIGASWKFRGNFFCKEGILLFESDVIFFSSNGDSIIDDKHLRIISQRRLRARNWKKTFSLQKYRSQFDLDIVETLKKILTYAKSDHFNISISDKFSKEPLNLRIEQGPKYDTLSSTGWRHWMEWWNSGLLYSAECLVVVNKSLTKLELQ